MSQYEQRGGQQQDNKQRTVQTTRYIKSKP